MIEQRTERQSCRRDSASGWSRSLRRAILRWTQGIRSRGTEPAEQAFEPRVGTLEPRIVLNATAELSAMAGLSIFGDAADDHVEIQVVDNGNAIQLVDATGNPIPIAGHTTGANGAQTDPLPIADIGGGRINVDLGDGDDSLRVQLPRPLGLSVVDGGGDDHVELEMTADVAPAVNSQIQINAESILIRPVGAMVNLVDRDIELVGDVTVGVNNALTEIDLGEGTLGVDGTLALEGSLRVSGLAGVVDLADASLVAAAGGFDLEIAMGAGSEVQLGNVHSFVDELSIAADDVSVTDDIRVGSASFSASRMVVSDAEIDASQRIIFSSDVEFEGLVTLDSTEVRFDGSVTVGAGASAVVEGALVDSTLQTAIEKLGDGEWVLSGDSDIQTDLSVNAGVLRVDGRLGASVDVDVLQDGTLSGSGALEGRAVLIGGTLAPAAPFPLDREGALRIATLDVDSDATLQFDVNGSVEGVTVDTAIVLNGPVNLAGAKVEFDQLAVLPRGRDFLILQNESNQSVAGRLTAMFDVDGNALATPRVLEEGDLLFANFGLGTDTPAFITYSGGDGNDVAIVTAGSHVQSGSAEATLITRVDSNLHIQQGDTLSDAQQAIPTIRPLNAINGNFVTVRGASATSELFVDVDGFSDSALPYDVNLLFQVSPNGNQGTATFFDSDRATDDQADTLRVEFVSADVLRLKASPTSLPDYDISLSGVAEVLWELTSDTGEFLGTNQNDMLIVDGGVVNGTTELSLDSEGLSHRFVIENPEESLSISARAGDDDLLIRSLDDSFNVVTSLSGDTGDDSLVWQTDAQLGIAGTGQGMMLSAERVLIDGDLELLSGGTLSVIAVDELEITGTLEVHEGQIEVASQALLSDLTDAVLRSSAVGDAILLSGGEYVIGEIVAPSGRVSLGPSLSQSIDDVTQAESTSIVADELIAHSGGSLTLDHVGNRFLRVDVRDAQDVVLVDSDGDLAISANVEGTFEARVVGSAALESIESPSEVLIAATDGISSVAGFDVNVTANEIDFVSGVDLAGTAIAIMPSLIGTATAPILVAPSGRISATTSGTNGSIFLQSLNNSVVGRIPIDRIDAGAGTIGITARTIDDVSSDEVADLVGDRIELNATTGIGATQTLTLTGASSLIAASDTGSIRLDLQADRELTVHADTGGRNQSQVLLQHTGTDRLLLERVANANGDVIVTSEDAEIVVLNVADAIEVGSAGVLRLSNETGEHDIVIQGGILSNAGAIDLHAMGNLRFESTSFIESVVGPITLEAGLRQSTTVGEIRLEDGSVLDAGRGTALLTAAGDISVSSIESDSTGNAITLVSVNGQILDNGDQHLDFVADQGLLRLVSQDGIGAQDPMESQVDRLEALVSGLGALRLSEATDIELVDVLAHDGLIEVTSSGDLVATSVRSNNESQIDGDDHRDIMLTTLDAVSDLMIDLVVAEGVSDVTLNSGDDVLAVRPASMLIADDLSITAANQNSDRGDSIRLQTNVEQLELRVLGAFAGDVRINEADRIELAASDRLDDTEVVTLGNGQLFVDAGETIVIRDAGAIADGVSLRDDVEIAANGSRGRIELTAGTSIEMDDSVQLYAEQISIGAVLLESPSIVFGDNIQIETGDAVGVARIFAPRPEAGVTDTAFYDFNTVRTNRLEQAMINDAVGILTIDIGNEGERGLTVNIDWGAESGRFQQIDGLSGDAPPLAVSHLYREVEILESRLNGRTSETAPLEVRFAVRHHESIIVRGQSVEQGESGAQLVEGELISSTDNPATFESSRVPILENGVASFIIPNLSIPVAFFPVRDVIPTIEVEPIVVPVEQTFTVLGGSVETVASVISGSTSRDEYFQIRVRSPDPFGEDLIQPTRLPDDIVSGDKLKQLFEELPDGRYEIEYVLGDGNVRSILSVELRDGKPIVPVENLEGGALRLSPMESEEAEPNDPLELPKPRVDEQSLNPVPPPLDEVTIKRAFSPSERFRSRLLNKLSELGPPPEQTVNSDLGGNADG
ncbi:MAG: hypothetical protein AAFX06_28900 [Planctomycetota bacterium]